MLNQNAEAKEKKLDTFQNLNDKSFKDYIHMVLQHMVLCEIWQNLASYPFPMLEFSNSKDSYTKFTLASLKFRRMRAFAGYKNEIWCMDLTYVDKLAKDNRGIKYLLVRQDVFDKTIDVRGLKS